MSGAARVDLTRALPAASKGLREMSDEVGRRAADAGLGPQLVELVKLRTSQLNGCAACMRLHTEEALRAGERAERLAVLGAWRETAEFSPAERAAMALAEAVTLVSDGHVPDDVYDEVAEALSEEQLAAVAWIAVVMNAFNRLAIASRSPVGPAAD